MPTTPIRVGLCAMEEKLRSRHMAAILNHLRRFDDLTLVPFGDDRLLSAPVDSWPVVDALIAFASPGFPLDKAAAYAALRRPLLINDVTSQSLLRDRGLVYLALKQSGIPVPEYRLFTADDSSELTAEDAAEENLDEERRAKYWGQADPLKETEDSITVDGQLFKKPFVEKPVDAMDHNIHIYYPKASGGGSKRIFRKTGDRSSRFYPSVSTVRRGGSYIYQEFVATDGAYIKVYTVGPDYTHAEARKAPTVDGRVTRTAEGKEVRYPIILTQDERDIAQRITKIFGQAVCGFKILRTDAGPLVIDVNGWSIVKGSPKFEGDCAQIIYEICMSALRPTAGVTSSAWALQQEKDALLAMGPDYDEIEWEKENGEESDEDALITTPRGLELRGVVAVIRHADRMPKQKVKITVTLPQVLRFFQNRQEGKQGEVRLKSTSQLQEWTEAVASILEQDRSGAQPLDDALRSAFQEINCVLSENATFSGINRKVQLKPIDVGSDGVVRSVLVVFKFGGQLTDFGKKQADLLGMMFRRKMYPADRSGLLELHSSFAHDLKFFASDEGRVQMSAAVFARSFLELDDEEIVPILFSLIWNDRRSNVLLEHSSSSSGLMLGMRKLLTEILNTDLDFSESNTALADDHVVSPGITVGLLRHMGFGAAVGNPRVLLKKLEGLVAAVCTQLCEKATSNPGDADLSRMQKIWVKIRDKLTTPDGLYDISKVPDILDCSRYDMLHHRATGVDFRSLFEAAKPMAGWVIAQEYGITEEQKREIASEICRPLLKRILSDLQGVCISKQQTVTRFYFTSEAHLQCLAHLFGVALGAQRTPCLEEDFLSHIVLKLFENRGVPPNDPKRFQAEVLHSHGSNSTNVPEPPGDMHNFIQPQQTLAADAPLASVISALTNVTTPPLSPIAVAKN